jgi:hypothetical protein
VTFTLPDDPPKVDLLFSFDLTGSIDGILVTAKLKALDIMDELDDTLPEVDFKVGVVSYMDYTLTPSGDNCGYGSVKALKTNPTNLVKA